MKRLVLLSIFLLLLLVAGCGVEENQAAVSDEKEKVTDFSYEDVGLLLHADIHIGQDIEVKARLENITDEPIKYNNRCGEPFHITMKLENTGVYLKSDEEPIACIEIFDPNDLVELAPGEQITKTVTFTREFALQNVEAVSALDGIYDLEFTFTTYGNGHFYASTPIELTHTSEPTIITLDEATNIALEDDEVRKWMETHEQQDSEVKQEEAFITDGQWYISFHTIGKENVYRIIIPVDIVTGDVNPINTEELPKDEGILDWLESQSD